MIFRPGLSPASHCQSPWIPAKAGMTSWRQTFVPHPLSQRACRFSGSGSAFQRNRSIRLGPPSSNPPPSLRRNRQPVDELQTGQFLQFSGRHFQLARAAARSQSYHQANDWRIPRSTALLLFSEPINLPLRGHRRIHLENRGLSEPCPANTRETSPRSPVARPSRPLVDTSLRPSPSRGCGHSS